MVRGLERSPIFWDNVRRVPERALSTLPWRSAAILAVPSPTCELTGQSSHSAVYRAAQCGRIVRGRWEREPTEGKEY